MRRGGYLALVVALIMLLTSPLYAAAPKAGAKCPKKSTTATSGGKLFTCIQSGKKLVWNKGVTIKKPIPATTPTPIVSPTPTPVTTPIPTPTFSVPDEPKNILNLESEYQGVAYWAWKKSSEKIFNSVSSVNHFEIHTGPNSGILNVRAKEATELTSRLYAGVRQPTKNYFISFSITDSQWAEKKIEEFLNDTVLLSQIRKSQSGPQDLRTYWACPTIERCHSSTAMNNNKGTAIVLAGYTPSRQNVITETQGWLQSHEHTHIIQQEQFMGTARENGGTINSFIYMQGWMIEGGANFGGYASTHYRSFEEYKKGRQAEVDRMPRLDSRWYENFINMTNQERDQFTQGEIYHIGFMINEIFTALKGPNAQMELYKKVASGKSFDESFEEVFGAPWKLAVPVIARVLASERIRN